MPDGLAAFIAERLDEAEAAAKAAELRFPGPWEQAENTDSPLPSAVTLYDSRDESVGVIRGSYAAAHIAANDPARELRAIAAKRAILTRYERACAQPEPVATWTAGQDDGYRQASEDALRDLAAEWDDHPAYQPEWTPEPAPVP